MFVNDIPKFGKLLAQFLRNFADCFARSARRRLLAVYVRGLLSDVQRKNVEAIALDQKVAPRTLQRFLESIAWDEQMLRDRCQQIVATEHTHPDAIGCIDETGTAKSGNHTAGVKRQYNGNRGKIENCVNNVAISYSAPGFNFLLDAQLYLPKEWTEDPTRRTIKGVEQSKGAGLFDVFLSSDRDRFWLLDRKNRYAAITSGRRSRRTLSCPQSGKSARRYFSQRRRLRCLRADSASRV